MSSCSSVTIRASSLENKCMRSICDKSRKELHPDQAEAENTSTGSDSTLTTPGTTPNTALVHEWLHTFPVQETELFELNATEIPLPESFDPRPRLQKYTFELMRSLSPSKWRVPRRVPSYQSMRYRLIPRLEDLFATIEAKGVDQLVDPSGLEALHACVRLVVLLRTLRYADPIGPTFESEPLEWPWVELSKEEKEKLMKNVYFEVDEILWGGPTVVDCEGRTVSSAYGRMITSLYKAGLW